MEKQTATKVGGRENSSEELLSLNKRERRRLTRAQRHQLSSNKSSDWSNTERRTSESGIRGNARQQSTESVESSAPSEAAAELEIQTSESRNWSSEKTRKNGGSNDDMKCKFESSKTTAYMFKAKILVIGPQECGKTVISNYLADATEISGGDYHPTQGVRILEFESSGIPVGGKDLSCEVELWDCSGDQRFENCWPAIQKDANGILFVYNPDNTSHGKELETLYVHFVQEQGLKDSQCMLFAHHKPGANEKTRSQLPSYLSKIPCVQTNLEDDSDVVKQKFNDLLAVLLRNWTDRRDQEELSIMNN